MIPKVLITTSGIGSRLKFLTKKTNKALINIAGKPAIKYILEKYPVDTEFVITLGHLGQQVKKFLLKNYPQSKFNFVKVDNYDKPGSSLGYSMLCAKSKLQCSFIFHCCVTLTDDEIPTVTNYNWLA